MTVLDSSRRYFFYRPPLDIRKSIYDLCALPKFVNVVDCFA